MTTPTERPPIRPLGDPAPSQARRAWLPPVLLLAAVAVVSVIGSPVVVRLATLAAIYAIVAIGLSVLSGTARIVSLCSSAFVGLGAFVAASLLDRLQLPVAVIVAAAACMGVGLLISPIAGRLSGVFFAILTIGVALLAQHIFRIATGWTGGTAGLVVADPMIGGIVVNRAISLGSVTVLGDTVYFGVCAVVLLLVTVATTHLLRARTGRALATLASSTVTARSFGINPARYRSTAFIFSSSLAGVAGALLASFSGFLGYEQFGVELSIQLLAVVVLGGLGSVYGVLIASVILVGLPEVVLSLRSVLPVIAPAGSTTGITAEQVSTVLYGLALVVVMVAEPDGLAGLWRRLTAFRSRSPQDTDDPSSADPGEPAPAPATLAANEVPTRRPR